MRNTLAEDVERRGEIDLLHLLPYGVGGLGNRWAAGKTSENVDQNVEASVSLHNPRHAATDFVQLVEIDHQRFKIGFRKIPGRDAQRTSDDAGAPLEKCASHRRAQASAGSGDENNFIFHGNRPSRNPLYR